ncbi:adenine phosphoribosyltransferase [Angomonas deanei]|uniref:Phosphoribosyl transferase domain containing protein n=1 Tax=Angomonas deanei TaxID=59799 RepID=A0A7G2CN75_9TRYP|nr:adenine phosphoribosyltransferase [Angomonas deanei]CAD2221310.1 hypothetical protein, conserved [Angomonas deanei]|eukprot:EPY16570.1 adenine phosphoribosyltransferase [Angomonas deanei]
MHLSDGNSWARAVLEQRKIPLRSFVRVRCDAANYKVEESTQHSLRSAAERGKVTTVAPYPYDTIRVASDKSAWATQLSQLTPAEVEERERTIETVFVGIPIIHNKEVDYPYCYFSFTDFIPALEPSIVEAMADLCVYYFYQGTPEPCNVLVSEGDRGGASLLHAVALRLQLPYVVAHWLTSATQASPVSTGDRRASVRSHVTSIGFSGGESQLALNGIKEGDCCLFVDDMLSSGGTAEAIFDCVTERGGEVKAALFGSEKLYPVGDTDELERKGFKRIGLIYPECRLITLTQFIVRGTVTQAPSQRVESHEGI